MSNDNQNNTEEKDNNDKMNERLFLSIVTNNTQINNALTLFSGINLEVLEIMIDKTPDNLKHSTNYKTLVAVKDFYKVLLDIGSQNEAEPSNVITPNLF